MSEDLPSVLAAVEGWVSYLRARPEPPDEPGWRNADELTGRDVMAQVDAHQSADRRVAASLFVQSYAFKVGAVSLAAYALGLPWPVPSAQNAAVHLERGRATGLAFRSLDLGRPADVAGLAGALFDGHVAPLCALVRANVRVGERLLWGNVAASTAAAFRAIEGVAGQRSDAARRAAVRERATAFLAARDELRRAGRFERVEAAGGDGWFWTRTSCCLWFRVSGGATCDDCSLIAPPQLELRRRHEIVGATR